MIVYSPLDGLPLQLSVQSRARHCFLMTRLGKQVPAMVDQIRASVESCCRSNKYEVIDAQVRVTGRDFLLKIWKLIASTPLSVGVIHEDIPDTTKANIYYEMGVAQALGKETVIVKSPNADVPSDFVRTEYIEFDNAFESKFTDYLGSIIEQANYYETLADQLEKNPVLALDYLKRAYLITGNNKLKEKASSVVKNAGLEERAVNSVELQVAAFSQEIH